MTIEFNIKNQIITRLDDFPVVADSIDYLTAGFTFTEDWAGLAKTAVFRHGTDTPYCAVLQNDSCTVPAEVIKSDGFTVSVFGGSLITANTASVRVYASGYAEGQTPAEPTPDVYSQITAELAGTRETAIQQADRAATSETNAAGSAGTAVEQAQAASINRDATDQNATSVAADKETVAADKAAVAADKAEVLAAEQRVIALMSTDTRSYFFATLNERDAFVGFRNCDRCSVLETRSDYIYDDHDVDSDSINPEWILTSQWDALKTVAWEIITGKPDFSQVAVTGSYLDLSDKPNRYESFATFSELDYNVNTNTLTWDYSRSDKAVAELSQDVNISVANIYNGAIGLIKVYGGYSLILPESSKKSLDFDYVNAGTGGHYVYTFVYDGTYFCWSRSVCV